ncbi:MAG: YdjY domain-containing protein [bacterium]|nr:YdjY domain-containing protein [bacterium]
MVISLCFFWFGVVNSQPPPATPQANPVDQIEIVDSTTVRLGNIEIDRALGEISCPGSVNLDTGIVEYLAVAPGGKTHESVLVLDIKPMHLQLALLLLGLDYGQNLRYQGDTLLPVGDSVSIAVEWQGENGTTHRYPAHELIANYATGNKMPETGWIFTGSFVYEGGFAADGDGSLIATYTDPAAILNNPLPDRMDDTYLGVNSEIVPQVKTEIRMIIMKK